MARGDTDGPQAAARRICTAAVVAVALGAVLAGLLGLDTWLYQLSLWTNTPHPLDRDFYRLTRWFWDICRIPGSLGGGLCAYLAILALRRDGRWEANAGAAAVLLADGTALLIKHLVGRPRPNVTASPLAALHASGNWESHLAVSFPSGEATAAFALASVLARLLPRWRALFYAAAALTGVARLIQGSHYFSDVVAGALLGRLLAGGGYRLLERYRAVRSTNDSRRSSR